MADPHPKKGEIVVDEATGKELVRQGDGQLVEQRWHTPPQGGRLKIGNPGNKGGPGRKPDEVRRYFLELATLGLDEVKRRFDPETIATMDDADLAKFLDVFGKYSVGTKHQHSGPDDGPLAMGVMILPELQRDGEDSGDDS